MNRLKFFFRCAISAALVWFVLRKVNWSELGTALHRIDWRVALPASLLVAPLIAMLAARWRLFLRQQGVVIPFRVVFPLTWAGQFFNSVLPGSTGGDFVKIYQVCKLVPDRRAAAAASVVVDRFTALVALLVLAGTALVIDPVPLWYVESLAGSVQKTLLVFAILGVIGLVAAWAGYRAIRSTHWHGKLHRTLSALKNSLVINRVLFVAMLMSFAIHCLNFLIVFLFARALGIGITYSQVLLIFPVVLLLVMAPVTVNGHGLREVLLIFYFTHLHISISGDASIGVRETVIALSIVLASNDLLWSLPGGLWYMLRFKRSAEIKDAAV